MDARVRGPPLTSAEIPPIKDDLGDRYTIEAQRIETPDVLIYQATDVRADRPIRLIVSRHRIVDDPMAVKRFYRAAFGATLLEFPNLVRVFGYGLLEDAPYIAVDPVAGVSLATSIDHVDPIDLETTFRITRAVLAGLTDIHRAGFVHGQLAPEAIRLDLDGHARLIPTWVPVAVSSVKEDPFASPEVVAGELPNARSDIFSAGKLLSKLVDRLNTDAVPAASIEALRAIAKQATSERQGERFSTASEMERALVDTLLVPADTRPLGVVEDAAPVEPRPPVKPIELVTDPGAVDAPIAETGDEDDPALAGAVALRETVPSHGRFPFAWLASAIGAVLILIVLLAALAKIVGDPRLRAETRPTVTATVSSVLAAAPATPTPRKIVVINDPIFTPTPSQAATAAPTLEPTATVGPVAPRFEQTFGPELFTGCLYRGDAGFLGRPWCSVYGANSGFGVGTLTFQLDTNPAGKIELELTGLDDQSGEASKIEITVNGKRIFSGDSPFFAWDGVTDDAPWSRQTFELPAGTLREGRNEIIVSNLNPSANYGRPPFVLISKVVLRSA